MYIRYDKIAVKHIESLDKTCKQRIKTAIENMTGLTVADVNIRVAGVDVE